MVTVSSTGRALHDYIAGTVVVRRGSAGPVVSPSRRTRRWWRSFESWIL